MKHLICVWAGIGLLRLSGMSHAAVLVNHLGYLEGEAKTFLVNGSESAASFTLEREDTTTVFTGPLVRGEMDLGDWLAGDFSAYAAPGNYRIRAGSQLSRIFPIGPAARSNYQSLLQAAGYGYFHAQRCGDTNEGWRHQPCHLDDGRRLDNGQHADVAGGGWHDACDLRKWTSTTILAMLGMEAVKSLAQPSWDSGLLLDELKWGNRYFLKMQQPDGSMWNYCGGDDGNHWTDNVAGNSDDRPIHTDLADERTLYYLIAAEAWAFNLFHDEDQAFAATCLEAANRSISYMQQIQPQPPSWYASGMGILAAISLHEATGDSQYLDLAASMADAFIALQSQTYEGGQNQIKGYFYTTTGRTDYLKASAGENFGGVGLALLLEKYPTHANAAIWQESLRSYVQDYLSVISAKNAFGLTPYGLYSGSDPGGGRAIGDLYYRYFMQPSLSWWVGMNSNLLVHALVLEKAARVLHQDAYRALAWRQLDWVLGGNPFDASTIIDFGFNQPQMYQAGEFSPPTPPIPGAVMNGIGGDAGDLPSIVPGSWQTGEFWTPHNAFLSWLISELLATSPVVDDVPPKAPTGFLIIAAP